MDTVSQLHSILTDKLVQKLKAPDPKGNSPVDKLFRKIAKLLITSEILKERCLSNLQPMEGRPVEHNTSSI